MCYIEWAVSVNTFTRKISWYYDSRHDLDKRVIIVELKFDTFKSPRQLVTLNVQTGPK